ncbi:hypothetical protein D3C78_1663310 [compost metagenome]
MNRPIDSPRSACQYMGSSGSCAPTCLSAFWNSRKAMLPITAASTRRQAGTATPKSVTCRSMRSPTPEPTSRPMNSGT